MKITNLRSRSLALKILKEFENCTESSFYTAVDSANIPEIILTFNFRDAEATTYILETPFFNEFLKPFINNERPI